MEYQTTCPIDGTPRPFYRFAAEGFSPFTSDQMERLRQEVNSEPGLREGIPHNLREFTVAQINDRSKKTLTFKEFDHWMSQRAVIAEHMWAEYITLDQHYQSQDANKTHQGLWDLMLQSLKDDDSVKVTEDNPIESFMTIKAMAEYCIKKNW